MFSENSPTKVTIDKSIRKEAMFEIKSINEGDEPNDGDIFQITCSRNELILIHKAMEGNLRLSRVWQKIKLALLGKVKF